MISKIIEFGANLFGSSKAAGSVSKYLKKNPWVGTAASYGMQRRDANRAHQRQMHDLRKAGINPILSAKLGGAQTPQMGDMGQVMNTARQIDQTENLTNAQVDQIQKNIDQLDETIRFSKNQNEVKEMILKTFREHPELAFWNDVFKGTDPKDWLSALSYDEVLNKAKEVSTELKKSIQQNKQGSNPYRN